MNPFILFIVASFSTLSLGQNLLIRRPDTLELFQVGKKVTLLNLPDVRQSTPYTCGPSSLQAVLKYYGVDIREDKLAALAHTTPDSGSTPTNLLKAAKILGFNGQLRENLDIQDLVYYIAQEIPVIVAIQAFRDDASIPWQADWEDGHYVVVIGYDEENIYFQDPSELGSIGSIPKTQFLSRWHDIDGNGRRYFEMGLIVNGARRDIPLVIKIL